MNTLDNFFFSQMKFAVSNLFSLNLSSSHNMLRPHFSKKGILVMDGTLVLLGPIKFSE